MYSDEQLLTTDELVAYLKMSKAHFYKVKSEGKIPPPVYVGKRPRYALSEVIRWLQKHRRKPT